MSTTFFKMATFKNKFTLQILKLVDSRQTEKKSELKLLHALTAELLVLLALLAAVSDIMQKFQQLHT